MPDLQEILDTMDIPEKRKTDMAWLWRNIGVRNSGHPFFAEAKFKIKQCLVKDLLKGDI